MGKGSSFRLSAAIFLSFPFFFFYFYLRLVPLVGDACTFMGETFPFLPFSNSCLFVSLRGDNSLHSLWPILAVFFRDAEADLDLDAS